MPQTKIRLGTASPGTRATTKETLAQLEQITKRAAEKKIDILLLPEAYIGGYPRGTSFGCVIGSRTMEGRDEYLRYFQSAVDLGDTVGNGAGAGDAWIKRELPTDRVPGSEKEGEAKNIRGDGTREELERIARETGVFLVTGLIEKTGGSMYCSVVYVCPKLGVIGKRRKVMPTGTERLVWAQGSPATLRAVSTVIRGVRVNLAAAICWENYMPLLRQSLYSQNINLYLAPTADGRDAWLGLMRTAALEGRCFVVSSNMCVRKDTPPSPPSPRTVSPGTITPTTNGGQGYETATDEEEDGSAADPNPMTGRRSSFVTEEGFEIALPCKTNPKPKSRLSSFSSAAATSAPRRQSIIDEDGNEIVLCCGKKSKTSFSFSSTKPNVTRQNGAPKTTTVSQVAAGEEAFVSRGGSAIINPFGDVVAGPQWEDDEGIIYADVDFEDCIRGRLDLDAAGSYSRNDSFHFSVEGLDLSPLPYH